MKKVLKWLGGLFIAFVVLVILVPSPDDNEIKKVEISNVDYFTMKSEVICGSKYSDAKIESLFKEKYDDKYVKWDGIVSEVDGDVLRLKMKPSTITYDVEIDMNNKDQLFDLEKDQTVTVQFKIVEKGGCFLPLVGRRGVLV
ncbi:hypothetical protein GCM10007938_42180 [Vibrio zhanjiangensis]|uniref:Uncharacterized protein n=1 Tax=Vibrio zhanjiangensis TaxID=1046128 RepID=A0ABQ6F4H0_9VIBR|nr:hypothetical protein [Vibrio zhanjiangensis]GLT20433.1 hypothetical protein GCM10007938_42180 [Vibrio zhanjiangensis]